MKWFIEQEPRKKRYNVCRGSKTDLYSLAGIVRRTLGIDCGIKVFQDGWKPEYTGDNSRLLAELGAYAFTSFERSVEEFCDYYKANLQEIDGAKLL